MSETNTAKTDLRDKVHAELAAEIRTGGTAAACPFCNVPRVQRSDYIRCCKCGVNWLPGENLSADPRIERYTRMVASLRASAPTNAPRNA